MTDYSSLEPQAKRLIGLKGEALSAEWEKIAKEVRGNCGKVDRKVSDADHQINPDYQLKSASKAPEPQVEIKPDTQTVKGIQAIMSDHIPDELNELRNDMFNLFDLFMGVHKSAYTEVGGIDIVVNGFSKNAFFRSMNQLIHPRFLSTYNSVVGVREFHKRKGVYDKAHWESLSIGIAVQVSEDILFAAYGGAIPPSYYVHLLGSQALGEQG